MKRCCHWRSLQNQEAVLVLQKRIYQIQTDLGTAQTQFTETTEKLDTTSKSLTAVSNLTRGQSNLTIAASNARPQLSQHFYSHLSLITGGSAPPCDTHTGPRSLCPSSLHPKQDLDPCSRSFFQGADAWQTDWQTHGNVGRNSTHVCIRCGPIIVNCWFISCCTTLQLYIILMSFNRPIIG